MIAGSQARTAWPVAHHWPPCSPRHWWGGDHRPGHWAEERRLKGKSLCPHWAWGPEPLPAHWARSSLPLPPRIPAGLQASCLGFSLLLFLLWVFKLPAKTAKAKGSTCLSQAKLTCPSTLFYGLKFLPGPRRGQRKWGTVSHHCSLPTSLGLLALDHETRASSLGHLMDCSVAADGG